MPTVADLERLQALVSRLVPLATAQPRTLIRSEDWNLVVGALIETARSVLAAGDAAVVLPHDHSDQVQLSWLDARLRSLLEQGPLTDPASLARLDDLNRRIDQTGSLLDGTRADVADIRARTADVATRDLIREADVTKIRRTVEALGDSRADVLTLRQSLEALRADLRRAIEVGRQLEINGQPLDVPALVSRVDSLEALRAHLTMPDGQPLDATALELRLTELTNTLVTEQELDEALHELHPELSAEVTAQLKEEILGAADTRTGQVADGLRAELGARIDDRLSGVDTKVGLAVQAALPGVREQVLDAARGEITAAVGQAGTEQRAFTEQRLAQVTGQLDGTLSARIDTVQAGVAPAAEAEVGRQLDARLPQVQSGIDAVGARVDGLDARAGTAESALAQHTALLAGLQSAVTTLSGRLDAQLAAVLDQADAHAAQMIEAASERLRTELSELAGKLVADRVADAINQVRGEMREIARDEIGAAMPEIDARVARILDLQLPDRVLAIFKADFEKRGPLYQLIVKARPDLVGVTGVPEGSTPRGGVPEGSTSEGGAPAAGTPEAGTPTAGEPAKPPARKPARRRATKKPPP